MNSRRIVHTSRTAVLFAAMTACTMLLSGMTHAAEEERLRTITVTGQGETQAEPDRAIVQLGVESRKPKMEDARAEVTKTVDAVLKLTRELQIESRHVRATRINIQPEYNWDNSTRERHLIGYHVSRQIEIELRDLDRLGHLLERSFDLGVNQAGDPRLDSSKRRDLEREALAKAVRDARLNAEAVAKAAGARIGAPRSISAGSGYVQPPLPVRMKAVAMAESVDASQSYQSGQMTFNGSVQIEYDLMPLPGQ
ncbi:hypothetical protein ACG33_14590 [Steroidobacter denitrificans]|uniref:Periplasmic immunogenic protein n=1 Tax=Steroidobacter denitrificans TaxID=465721 RepID=A0A127FD19_STEDE|nr:SIMPL domain-containing protein [Steroidobacter denitrificans]AMN48304.1 hypothetical protein ACG33_14590 [Steroidobacter denitrificans]